jgi:hypothetical protein
MRRAYHYRHRLRRPLANLISSSLEVAYLAGAAHAAIAASGDGDPRPLGDTDEGQDDEMVFTGISLSCATEGELLVRAREHSHRQGAAVDPDLDTFMYRRLGQLLEAPYNRRT